MPVRIPSAFTAARLLAQPFRKHTKFGGSFRFFAGNRTEHPRVPIGMPDISFNVAGKAKETDVWVSPTTFDRLALMCARLRGRVMSSRRRTPWCRRRSSL